ncbi:MAG: CRISPR-associated protein Cas4 [Nanopusillaceae archaeon]
MIYVRVTDLLDYLFCPRKVYLKRILGLKEETNYQILVGKIVHEIFDFLNENESKIIYEIKDECDFPYVYNIYKNFLDKIYENLIEKYADEIKNLKISLDNLKTDIFSNVLFDIEDRAKLVYQFMITEKLYGIELWEKLEPKIYTELEVISDAYNLIGRIDRIEKYRTIIIPYEIKSGKFSKDHLLQLHAYYLLLRKEFPNYKIPYGIVMYLKNKSKKEIKFFNYKLKKVLELKDKILDILEKQSDPGIIKKINKCKKCFFFNYCYKT